MTAPDAPCERCAFIDTPGGKCMCRVPTDDDVPLFGGDDDA